MLKSKQTFFKKLLNVEMEEQAFAKVISSSIKQLFLFLLLLSSASAYATIPQAAKSDPKFDLGYLVVTHYPGVNSNGTGDSRAGIQEAINDAFKNKLTLFFPEGTYVVSDVLTAYHWASWNKNKNRSNNPPGRKAHVWTGSTAGNSRPLIKLSANAKGFDNPDTPRPIISWRYFVPLNSSAVAAKPKDPISGLPANFKEVQSVVFGWGLKNIDLDLNGHAGAIGGHFAGAQYSGISNCKITATGGYAGILRVPGRNSYIANVEIVGGQFGIIVKGAAGSVLVGSKFRNQTKSAVDISDFVPYAMVGLDIVTNGSRAISVSNSVNARSAVGSFSLVDSKIEMTNGGTAIDNSKGKTIYLENVFVKGATQMIDSRGEASIPGREIWKHIKEYVYQDKRVVDHKKVFNTYSIIDGDVKKNDETETLKVIENTDPTSSFLSRHLLGYIPFFEGIKTKTANVKEAPYNAKGNGVDDDWSAIQNAINNSANGEVFLPKGDYLITKPLVLKANTKLFGVSQNFSVLHTNSKWQGGATAAMVKTVDDANAETFFGDIGFEDAATSDASITGGFIHWKAGRKSMVMNCRHGKKYGLHYTKKAHNNYYFSSNAGGKHFINAHYEDVASSVDARHVLIKNTSQPLTFYGLNVESTKDRLIKKIKGLDTRMGTNIEIVNSSNIRIHSIKREGNSPTAIIRDSKNIAFYGLGRMRSPIPKKLGGFFQVLGNSDDILVGAFILSHEVGDSPTLFQERINGLDPITVVVPANISIYKRGKLTDIYADTSDSGTS
jgi:hypothetical protein